MDMQFKTGVSFVLAVMSYFSDGSSVQTRITMIDARAKRDTSHLHWLAVKLKRN